MHHYQPIFKGFDDSTEVAPSIFVATRVQSRSSLRSIVSVVCVNHTIRNRVVFSKLLSFQTLARENIYARGFKDLSPNCTRLQVPTVKPSAAFAPLLAVCALQGLTA